MIRECMRDRVHQNQRAPLVSRRLWEEGGREGEGGRRCQGWRTVSSFLPPQVSSSCDPRWADLLARELVADQHSAERYQGGPGS
eukprot:706650-Hanusia_phi.AAC.1